MNYPAYRWIGFVLLFFVLLRVSSAEEYGVCVYGGTPAGVAAAVASARHGVPTILVNPSAHLGGMVSGGLGVTDAGRVATIGGISGEFFQRIGRHYGQKGPSFRHEPHVAEQIFRAMLKEAGVQIWENSPLAAESPMTLEDRRITQIRLSDGRTVRAKYFIDATYEGDLMAQAGIPFVVGREAVSVYGENLAGVRKKIRHGDSTFASDKKGILPDIHQGSVGEEGSGDARIMSYNFRLCLTKDNDNQVPIGPPPRYDPRRYTLISRVVLSRPHATLASLFSIGLLPGGKADFNNIGPISSNLLNASWSYPEASVAERQRIWEDHRDYLQGLLYFLQNDSTVPSAVQNEARQWALPKDEFSATGHWPPQLYVREARRMVGEKVMTQQDLQERLVQEDSVGMGSYMMDSHYVQRTLDQDGLFSEGTLGGDHRVRPYQISYRSLLPPRDRCTNLLVPVCLSASHVAWSSLRMEPVFMILGHAAGTAAALALKENSFVQDLPYSLLRESLQNEGQILAYQIPGLLTAEDLEGIVLDEDQAQLQGSWLKSTSGEPFVGQGYIHDNNTDKGGRIATYRFEVPIPGRYEIRVYSATGPNRATNVPVTLRADDGVHTFTLNQKAPRPPTTPYHSLGTYPFSGSGSVEISNAGTDGVVVADAIQVLSHRIDTSLRTALAERILALQLPDGAFRMNDTSDSVRIVPYFANIAALALLSADASAYREPVRRWIEWYAAHQETDGTIYDFTGTIGDVRKSGHRDSTDSYAATFLQLISRYNQAFGSESITPAMRTAAIGAFRAIELTLQPDGLTWAKPDYKAKYLMDNLEVAAAWKEAQTFFNEIGQAELTARCQTYREKLEIALRSFWQADLGYFAWAKGSSGAYQSSFHRWYPDGVVHLFALGQKVDAPPALWPRVREQFGTEKKLTPEWWLLAALQVGTAEEKETYRRQTEEFATTLIHDDGPLNRLGTTLLALVAQ